MSRQTSQRNLTLTEELEKLEQSITLTLQEIDSNFSKAHRIVTTSILPIVEQYQKHSEDVWEGSKFWKQFFEASANVSLSGYEENANEDDLTHNDTTSTQLDTPTDHGEYAEGGAQQQDEEEEEEEEFTVDSPTQVTGLQTTPKLPSTTKKTNNKATAFRSPSPRKYTGKNPLALNASDEPSTPRPQAEASTAPQSSPFEPESAYQPSAQKYSSRKNNNDPLMHRVLDKNYRVQATPHTQRRQRQQQPSAAKEAAPKPTSANTTTTTTTRLPWDSSLTPPSKTAIVTGSSRGIGRAIAIRLAQDGYDVCINDVAANEKGCHEVAEEIKKSGRKACVAVADVTKLKEVEGMIETSVKELGELNCLVANAGIAAVKSLLDTSEEEFQNIFAVNVFGVQNCFQAGAKQLIKQGNCTADKPGKLIGCASIVAFKPFPLLSHYSASKWAVRGLTQAYAMEMAKYNITVNAYAPGIVGTAMWDLIDAELAKEEGKKRGEVMDYYVKQLTALGRVSQPEDVAKLVSFLGGPDSNFVTGQTQVVDGGIIFT